MKDTLEMYQCYYILVQGTHDWNYVSCLHWFTLNEWMLWEIFLLEHENGWRKKVKHEMWNTGISPAEQIMYVMTAA